MAQLDVKINGRDYRLACEDGQEPHLRALAQKLDQTVTDMRRNFGEIGENRLLVMAGLMGIDQLDELRVKITKLENDANAIRVEQSVHSAKADDAEDIIVEALTAASERIERLTASLGAGPN